MGKIMAEELAGMPRLSLPDQIEIHLRYNHYPPVHLSMVSACVDAIDACSNGQEDKIIALPDGVSWRGRVSAPAWVIVDHHHLGSWVEELS